MKYIGRYCIRLFISIIDLFVPTNKNRWVFYITPKTSWDANMQCVYALARKRRNLQCVIVYLHPDSLPQLSNTLCFSFLSLLGLWNCMHAGVIFFDHALVPGMTHYRRQCINLWHGIPIKQIRFFCRENFPYGYLVGQSRNTTLLISSSPVDRLAMSAGFQVVPDSVVITGLPRNDILLNDDPFIEALPYLADERQRIVNIKHGRRLILYAPTYREKPQSEISMLDLTGKGEESLAVILQKHNAILGVREHLYSPRLLFSSLYESGLAVALPTQSFSNTNLLLTNVDLLITDYSSVWVDYLLLDRPIIGFCPDLEAYIDQRGFLYDFLNIFPGPVTRSILELAEKIDTALSKAENERSEKQYLVRQLFHQYSDARNTERVIEIVQQRSRKVVK